MKELRRATDLALRATKHTARAVGTHINLQGGSRSRTLDRLARRLLLWSQDKFLSLRAVHVPGILNLAADFLSRQKLRPGEWRLNRQTVSQIWDLFGKAEVDLFASQESSQCPLWFSLGFPTTLGIDAFAHPWPNVSLYAFPPIKLIPAVLCRAVVLEFSLSLSFAFKYLINACAHFAFTFISGQLRF